MEEEKCVVVFEGTFNEGMVGSAEQREYSQRSAANAEAYGGFAILSNYSVEQNLGTGLVPDFVVVAEYRSRDKAIQSLASDEYQSIIPLRDLTFKEVKILITSQN